MPSVKVASPDASRACIVPVTPETTVDALLRSALKRLGDELDDCDVEALELVLESDRRTVLFADDAALDVIEGGQEVLIQRKSSRKRQRKSLDAEPAAAAVVAAAAAVPEMIAAGDGPLEVHWSLQTGECGTLRVDPVTACLSVLAESIASQLAALAKRGDDDDAASAAEGHIAVELFAEEGHPLGSSGAKRLEPLVSLGWPASGHAKCYAVSCSTNDDSTEPPGTADPNEGKQQLFVRADRTVIVNGELEDSVLTLKMKIKAKTGWPVNRQLLTCNAKRLRDNDSTLADFGISGGQTIHVKLSLPPASKTLTGWSSNFAAPVYEPVVYQTAAGVAAFYSTLYVLSKACRPDQKKLLGTLRRLTAFPPLISAVHELFQTRQLSRPHRIAAVEGLYTLFRAIAPRALPGASAANPGYGDEKVFEASAKCWAWILGQRTDVDADTEKWEEVDLTCALSHGQLGDLPSEDVLRPPAWWRADRVRGRACSRAALLEAIEKQTQEVATTASSDAPRLLAAADLEPASDMARIIAGHLGQQVVSIWQLPALAGPPPSLDAPTGDAWGALDEAIKTAIDGHLVVRSPLELKSGGVRAPALVRNPVNGTHLCVYVSRTKATVPQGEVYDPLSGGNSAHDFDDWAAALSDGVYRPDDDAAADSVPRVTRPPREAIVVLLDVSTSMTWDGFTVPRVDFDPVDRSRALGDVQAGDTVRFSKPLQPADADGMPLPFPALLMGTVTDEETPVPQGRFTADEAKKLTVPKLKAELDKLGLSTDGLKAALLERLLQALSAPPAANTERVVYVQFDGGADNASMQYLCQRDWCSTLVKAADLEVLTPRGAAALKPLPRIDTVKQLFAGFANRSMAYDLPHVIGLTTFGSEVVRVRQLTEAFESFRRAVDRTAANGQTKLFDALEMARAELATFCDGLANAPPEGVLKRILVLTDGEDTASDIEAHDVSAALQREGVIVDSVVIGNDTSSTKVSTS